jgi:hypothetical protein
LSIPTDPSVVSLLLENHQLRRLAKVTREDDDDDGPDFTEAIAVEVLRMVEREQA